MLGLYNPAMRSIRIYRRRRLQSFARGSQVLGGRKVDLRTREDLSHYFRDEVVRTAEVQYVAR